MDAKAAKCEADTFKVFNDALDIIDLAAKVEKAAKGKNARVVIFGILDKHLTQYETAIRQSIAEEVKGLHVDSSPEGTQTVTRSQVLDLLTHSKESEMSKTAETLEAVAKTGKHFLIRYINSECWDVMIGAEGVTFPNGKRESERFRTAQEALDYLVAETAKGGN